MARLKQKKGEAGSAVNYMTRAAAIKKLQLSLAAFRRLCILKGIYPREPANKKKAGKGSTAPRTYYYKKDIQYLLHEPVLQKFREQKIHAKKIKKAILKKEWAIVKSLEENRPEYQLDHIIKERYPTFVDALRDLDDALSMVFLFATLPANDKIKSAQVNACHRLAAEFMSLIMYQRLLRKVFLSVKGIYYQVEIMGQEITWIVPYQFTQHIPHDVDFKVMSTFLEVYITLIGFVNYKLYLDAELRYPPLFDAKRAASDAGITSYILESINNVSVELSLPEMEKPVVNTETMEARMSQVHQKLASMTSMEVDNEDKTDVDSEEEDLEEADNQLLSLKQLKAVSTTLSQFKTLFQGCVFWLSRETPRWSLEFVIRCFGGEVGWEDDSVQSVKGPLKQDKKMGVCAFKVNDSRITHHIVDRPMPEDGSIPSWMSFEHREYLQPQWIYDCINARRLLNSKGYRPGETLPPHLSPFVSYDEEDYKPEGAEMFTAVQKEEPSQPAPAADTEVSEQNLKLKQPVTAEEKERALMMMSKKDRHLYQKIQFGKNRKKAAAEALQRKKK